MSESPVDRAHRELVLRTLRIDDSTWSAAWADYERTVHPEAPVDVRVAAFGRSFASVDPHATPLPAIAPVRCPICNGSTRPALARKADADGVASLVYSRCAQCGHGFLSSESTASAEVYAKSDYYESRDRSGAGYDDYAGERAYRESKGARLVERIREVSQRPIQTMLEVGSGFGFTRAAAERAGISTSGIDRNAHAAAAAKRLYGFDTVVADFMTAAPRLGRRFDCVLFQFVLEHLEHPVAALRAGAALVESGGSVVLLVPSMDALEIEAFGASYRSLRSDHLHLFSRDSLRRSMAAAGLRELCFTSECNIHLLRDLLSDIELASMYATGLGPDLFVIATPA